MQWNPKGDWSNTELVTARLLPLKAMRRAVPGAWKESKLAAFPGTMTSGKCYKGDKEQIL